MSRRLVDLAEIKGLIGREYGVPPEGVRLVVETSGDGARELYAILPERDPTPRADASGPPCPECGGLTRRAGTCHLCETCGSTTGCG